MRTRHGTLLAHWLWPIVVAMGLGTSEGAGAQARQGSPLPKVVLIGDSIRMGYAPLVVAAFAGKAHVVHPKANGGDSANVLKNLDAWVVSEQPDIVHLNCGLHDLKRDKKTNKYQVELDAYERNLRRIVATLRERTKAALVLANTTPILDDRHAARRATFDRREADVVRYNDVLHRVAKELGVPVHDLHGLVHEAGAEQHLGRDGTHFTPSGNALLADAVVDVIGRQWTIHRYRPLPTPASGPAAVAEYRTQQAARDAAVPPRYRKLAVPDLPIPARAADWPSVRAKVLATVRETLGDLPPRPNPPKVRRVSRERHPTFRLERIALDNGVDGTVSALLLFPEGWAKPAPAVLWLHSSTPDKTQVLIPNTNGGEKPLGIALVERGYVVMAPDAYWHGDRAGTGPAGVFESSRQEHESLFKFHLWFGRTLWGMFVRDDQIALDYLVTRPEVDPRRIGATGMSMGSTRAWWLAAVDDRIAAAVGVACFTRYQNLIAHGELRQHGIYYFANGLLKHFDSEAVVALIAPRPFLALTGDLDAGSPADGVQALAERVSKVYALLGHKERFRSILYPDVGHAYTAPMRQEMLDWFERWLKRP